MTPADTMRAALEALTLARHAIEPLTDAQIKLYRIRRDTADKIDAALSLLRSALEGKPSEEEIREAMQASTQDTVPAWADDVLRRAASGVAACVPTEPKGGA